MNTVTYVNKQESLAEIRFCYKERVRGMYGYINRENDPILNDHPQKQIIQACGKYWGALFIAWEMYSKGNALVKQAELERDELVDKAYQQYLEDDAPKYDPKQFLKLTYSYYDQYAVKVGNIFHDFKKELKKHHPIII